MNHSDHTQFTQMIDKRAPHTQELHEFVKARKRYTLSQLATSSAHSPQLIFGFTCIFSSDSILILCLKVKRRDYYECRLCNKLKAVILRCFSSFFQNSSVILPILYRDFNTSPGITPDKQRFRANTNSMHVWGLYQRRI